MRKEFDVVFGKFQKRKYIEIDSDEEFRGELFFFWDIECFYKKLKFDKEIRLVIVMVGKID